MISPERVRISSTVTVEYDDSMILGEVVACTQDCNQQWHLELKIEQILSSLQSLTRLRDRLLGESVPSRMMPMTAGAHR